MSARLRYTVFVPREDGSTAKFGPGDEVPEWARKLITNPIAWEDEAEEGEADEGDGGALSFPEGSPDESWKVDELKAYAAERGIDLADATKKADILAAIELAGEA